MIAKLHDKNFRVTVPDFYDDVAKLSKAERKALNSLPWKEKDFRKTVGAPGYLRRKRIFYQSSSSGFVPLSTSTASGAATPAKAQRP